MANHDRVACCCDGCAADMMHSMRTCYDFVCVISHHSSIALETSDGRDIRQPSTDIFHHHKEMIRAMNIHETDKPSSL